MTASTQGTRHGSEPLGKAGERALVCELPEPLRRLRLDTLVHTLAAGAPIRSAALTVVLSAHDETMDEPLMFTGEHVEQLLWIGIPAFCAEHRLQVPDGCVDALFALLSVMAQVGSFAVGSDDVASIFEPLREMGVPNPLVRRV